YESRVKLIEQGALRLGLGNVTARVGDASVHDSTLPEADRVLCDVPCSGLGVIRRKPEIKYKRKDEIAGLPEIQKKIAGNAKGYVKHGGRLVYSTCTLNRAENEDIAEWLAAGDPEFTLIKTETYFPGDGGGDGFFTAVFERK
ncbi:MAG: 16S rRNA (cytosine(967)-C(5))-methyltransferase RsmB, partial [Ruminiclostridium sp.]|nr:16S rRNA (cytosine(967)-C(5))-methyltransferase RsmB [Ruminiclostridium sp.]